MSFAFITGEARRAHIDTDYIDNPIPFDNIVFGNRRVKLNNECTRLYNRHSLPMHLSCCHLNISTHLHASASHRVVKLISANRSCMPLLNVLSLRIAASIPLYDNDSSGKKNRTSAARRLSFAADDYFRAVESRIREKNSSLTAYIYIRRVSEFHKYPTHRSTFGYRRVFLVRSKTSPLKIYIYKLFKFYSYFSFPWK